MQVEMGWRSWAGGEGQLGNALTSHQDLQCCAASASLPASLPTIAARASSRPVPPHLHNDIIIQCAGRQLAPDLQADTRVVSHDGADAAERLLGGGDGRRG